MEARALYDRFEENLNTIIEVINSNVDLERTPFATSLPIEIGILVAVLNTTGANFSLNSSGLDTLTEFKNLYMQNHDQLASTMARILDDKRSYMKTPEGTLLTKEMLIRRLEYFNEAARTLMVMVTQQSLGSPLQYSYGQKSIK